MIYQFGGPHDQTQTVRRNARRHGRGDYGRFAAKCCARRRRARRGGILSCTSAATITASPDPGITSKENLEYNLRYGVEHLTAQVRQRAADGGWDPDELQKMKDDVRSGTASQFEAIRMDPDYITLRKGPERDRELAMILGNIEKASQHRRQRSSPIIGPSSRSGATARRPGGAKSLTPASSSRRTGRSCRWASPAE